MSHGLVMCPEHCDPSHLTKLGTVTITQDEIAFAGFRSDNSTSCRRAGAQALAWAIQVLQADLTAGMARPGGGRAGDETDPFDDDDE